MPTDQAHPLNSPRPTALSPLGSIRPAAWLREQLVVQAAGLSGHLDEFWPDVQDSAWIGGKQEGWEREAPTGWMG